LVGQNKKWSGTIRVLPYVFFGNSGFLRRGGGVCGAHPCPRLAKPHKTVESLKRALIKAWNEISVETLAKIVDDFPKRLKACVEAEGGHFE
jgi:hypothetical protein